MVKLLSWLQRSLQEIDEQSPFLLHFWPLEKREPFMRDVPKQLCLHKGSQQSIDLKSVLCGLCPLSDNV